MSNLQIIEELCGILHDLASLVEKQQATLAQIDAVALTDDYKAVKGRYTALLGRDEWPDDADSKD